jgi:hypothetical protein
MPAAEPKRELVMAAIAAQLATITAGSVSYPFSPFPVDYWTSPSLVSRELLWITQYDQPLTPPATTSRLDAGPVLGVTRSSGSTVERVQHGQSSRPALEAFEHEMRVTIWGFVKATSGVLAGTWIERLWQDHIACLLADPRLGGLARQPIEPEGVMDTDDGFLEPLAFFAQDWLIHA